MKGFYQSNKKPVNLKTLVSKFKRRLLENPYDRLLSDFLPVIFTCNEKAYDEMLDFLRPFLDNFLKIPTQTILDNKLTDEEMKDIKILGNALQYCCIKALLENIDRFEEYQKIADPAKVEEYRKGLFPHICINDQMPY